MMENKEQSDGVGDWTSVEPELDASEAETKHSSPGS